MLLPKLVTATKEEGSARVATASRAGSPISEESDTRGEGIVDFANDCVWTTDRLVTKRIDSDRRAGGGLIEHIINPTFHAFLNFVAGREVFYRGGARWKRRKKGWKGPSGAVGDPKNSWHPLFILDALMRTETPIVPLREYSDQIRSTQVSGVEFPLGPASFDAAVWSNLARPANQPGADGESKALREHVMVAIWFDQGHRIRRMSFEAVYNADPRLAPLWLVTELWDFGVTIDRDVPAEADSVLL